MFTHSGYMSRSFASDLRNGFTAREAKVQGLKLVRNGMLRRYYSLDGTLLFAYSYDACIYALVYDEAEGYHRDVFNLTKYSVTTTRHVGDIATELEMWSIVSEEWRWADSPPLTLRERRAMSFTRGLNNFSHTAFIAHLSEFINRYPSRAREYMARNNIVV